MTDVSTWDPSAAGNILPPPDGFPEGQTAGSLNNSSREVMAGVRRQWESRDWFDFGDTITRVSGTVFTVTGDLAHVYGVNRRLRMTGTLTLTIYGTISASAEGGGTTTVTVIWDSGSIQVDGDLAASVGIDVTGNPVSLSSVAGLESQWRSMDWYLVPSVGTYVSPTSFTVPGDQSDIFEAERRVQVQGTLTGLIHGWITGVSVATDTTVTVTWDSGSLSAEALTVSLGAQVTGQPIADAAVFNLADIRYQRDWHNLGDIPTYVTGSSFSVPTDRTGRYPPNRRLRLTGTGTGTIYVTVVSSTFGAVTTVVFSGATIQNEALELRASAHVAGEPLPFEAVNKLVAHWQDKEFYPWPEYIVRTAPTQFTVTGDQQGVFHAQRRLRFNATTTTYAIVASVAFGGGTTTVTISEGTIDTGSDIVVSLGSAVTGFPVSQSSVYGLNGRLDAIESVNSTQTTDIATNTSGVSNHEGRIGILESNDSTQDGRLNSIEGEQTTQNGRLASIESEQITQNNRLDSLEGAQSFPTGTRMLFRQASVPSGWTLVADMDDRVIRNRSGTGGGSGGSWTVSGLSAAGVSITAAQMPAHTHTGPSHFHAAGNLVYSGSASGSGASGRAATTSGVEDATPPITGNTAAAGTGATGSAGSNATHTHALSSNASWRPLYVDVVTGTKT